MWHFKDSRIDVPTIKQSPAVMARSTMNTDPPEGGDAKDPLCSFLHLSIPREGALPVCSRCPRVGGQALLQLLLAGQQLLLLCQQGLNLALNLQEEGKTQQLQATA